MPDDAVTRQLRALRQREGATATRLAEQDEVCLLLSGSRTPPATSELVHAFRLLWRTFRRSGKESAALDNAWGLGLVSPGSLARRRQTFAEKHHISVDTVENWENKALEHFAAAIQTNEAQELLSGVQYDSIGYHAFVSGSSITELHMIGLPEARRGESVMYHSNNHGHRGPPLFFVQYRRGFDISKLQIGVTFETIRPLRLYYFKCSSAMEMMFPHDHSPIRFLEPVAKTTFHTFMEPEPGWFYGMFWEWTDILPSARDTDGKPSGVIWPTG